MTTARRQPGRASQWGTEMNAVPWVSRFDTWRISCELYPTVRSDVRIYELVEPARQLCSTVPLAKGNSVDTRATGRGIMAELWGPAI
jgi:hypothetical protein